MVDNLVLTFGTIVENLLQEREEVGSGQQKEWVGRYTLTQLLDQAFVYPSRKEEKAIDASWSQVDGLLFDEVK